MGPNEGKVAACDCHCPRSVHMREVLARPWVGICVLLVIELGSIYFSSVTVFHDISKQIQQRSCIGKIFARWHLVIAITSYYYYYYYYYYYCCCYYYYYYYK